MWTLNDDAIARADRAMWFECRRLFRYGAYGDFRYAQIRRIAAGEQEGSFGAKRAFSRRRVADSTAAARVDQTRPQAPSAAFTLNHVIDAIPGSNMSAKFPLVGV
jgi:hypothetical protein